MLAQMHQEKADLEILLEANTEHFGTIELELEQQIEAERRQKEEQFQLITEATPVAILIAQITDGQILYANEMAGLIFGVSPSALLNYKSLDFYANPAERQQIMPLLAEGQSFQGEVRFKRVNGTPFWTLLSLRPFMFQGKRTILTALSDITDRKQAEEALRLAEENYRSIFENALDGIYQVTPTGQYLRINSAMAQILGYKSPEHMIATVTDVSDEYVDKHERDAFNQLMITSQGKITGYERRMYRQDGSIIWVSESARAVRDERGNLLYYEGIIEDITERKQMEERLRQQVQELQIEIDQTKRERQVAEIAQTDYFQRLLEEADALRYSED
jgi:PAS domain S-box-containing protein